MDKEGQGSGTLGELGCSLLVLVFFTLMVMLLIGSVGASIDWWLE